VDGLVEYGGKEIQPEQVLTVHDVSTVVVWCLCKNCQACDCVRGFLGSVHGGGTQTP
jgi:hypothetical protein